MKRFIGFVKKEFYHIIRDRRTLLILFGMPIAQILLFGFAITNEIRNVNIAVLDYSKDAETHKIVERISASQYFQVKALLHNERQIAETFEQGEVKAVVIFEPDFSEKEQTERQASVQLITDATEPNTANNIVNYIQSILLKHQQELNATTSIPYTINLHTRLYYNSELKSVFTFVPGVMTVILMLISAMMTSMSITREKELGTMEVLLVSPLNAVQVVVGKVFPYIFLAVINAIVILLIGHFILGMPIKGSLFLLAFETILFITTALSLGILISSVAQTQQAAMMASLVGLMLPVIILSGFIFPISSMPLPLQIISNIIPARWFIVIIKAVLLKGATIGYIWKETLVLVVMTLVFLGISVKKYKIRLE